MMSDAKKKTVATWNRLQEEAIAEIERNRMPPPENADEIIMEHVQAMLKKKADEEKHRGST